MNQETIRKVLHEKPLFPRLLLGIGLAFTALGGLIFAGFLGSWGDTITPLHGVPILVIGVILLLISLSIRPSGKEAYEEQQSILRDQEARLTELLTPDSTSASATRDRVTQKAIFASHLNTEEGALVKKVGANMLLSSHASVCGIVLQERREAGGTLKIACTDLDFLSGETQSRQFCLEAASVLLKWREQERKTLGITEKFVTVQVEPGEGEAPLTLFLPASYDAIVLLESIDRLTAQHS